MKMKMLIVIVLLIAIGFIIYKLFYRFDHYIPTEDGQISKDDTRVIPIGNYFVPLKFNNENVLAPYDMQSYVGQNVNVAKFIGLIPANKFGNSNEIKTVFIVKLDHEKNSHKLLGTRGCIPWFLSVETNSDNKTRSLYYEKLFAYLLLMNLEKLSLILNL